MTIGIVDSGVDATHPDLAGKIDALADCIGGSCREGTARDSDGHGTVVAGIAAAKTDNGTGIAGVAPDARLVIARVLGADGAGVTEDINRAIQWVVDKGARIVNLSLGEPDFVIVSRLGTPLKPGIEYAWSRGAIPVLASGNYEELGGSGSANYGDLHAVVVGATDKAGEVPPTPRRSATRSGASSLRAATATGPASISCRPSPAGATDGRRGRRWRHLMSAARWRCCWPKASARRPPSNGCSQPSTARSPAAWDARDASTPRLRSPHRLPPPRPLLRRGLRRLPVPVRTTSIPCSRGWPALLAVLAAGGTVGVWRRRAG